MELIPTALAILITAISPLIVGALTKASWSPKTKGWIALGVSVAVALGWTLATGGLGALTLAGGVPSFVEALGLTIAGVYALQQAVYALMFKGTDFAKELTHNVGLTDGESDATGSGFDAELESEELASEELEGEELGN